MSKLEFSIYKVTIDTLRSEKGYDYIKASKIALRYVRRLF